MEHTGNQAGPSSAKPETQPGLNDTVQLGEEIVKGARNDDQLEQLREGEKDQAEQKQNSGNGTD
jgi:hypothetical protein